MHNNSRIANILTWLFVLLLSLLPLLLTGCAPCVRYETVWEKRSRCDTSNIDGSCAHYATETVPYERCAEYEESEKSGGAGVSHPDIEFRPLEEGAKFSSRNKPASLTKKTWSQLIMEGYVNIGDVVVETGEFDRALQEAGRAGGDVVIYIKNRDYPNLGTYVFRTANDIDQKL